MAVGPAALEQKRMRPEAPASLVIEVAFRAGYDLVNQRDSTGKADAPRLGMRLEELRVRQAGDGDDLVHEQRRDADTVASEVESVFNR